MGSFADKHVGTAKPVTVTGVTLTGSSSGNYTVTQQTGLTANITAKPITVTAITNSKTYDGTTAAAALPNNSGVATGDTAGFSEAYTSRDFGVSNRTLAPSGVVSDGNSGANYTYTYNNFTTGTINKKAITVTAVANTKTYDGTTTAAAIPTNTGCRYGRYGQLHRGL